VKSGEHECRNLSSSDAKALIASGKPHCWRFRSPEAGGFFTFRDRLRGELSVPTDSTGDFVLARSDGSVTYLLAVVADDHDSNVTHVIRGEEHLSNVPKQELIYRSLGWRNPEWVHIPMILDAERHKLSKRSGAVSIESYRESLWSPGAIVSYLATLSWSGAPADAIRTPIELSRTFDLDSVALVPPIHDEARMRHFGRISLREISPAKLLDKCREAFPADSGGAAVPEEERIMLVGELSPACASIGELKDELTAALALPAQVADFTPPAWFAGLSRRLSGVSDIDWTSENLRGVMRSFQRESALRGTEYYHAIRIALTGRESGAPIALIMSCIGKSETERRLGDVLRN
jgi:glutamyl/glutaminyl-tRNA synthetase